MCIRDRFNTIASLLIKMDIYSIEPNQPENQRERERNVMVVCRIYPLPEKSPTCIEVNSKEKLTVRGSNSSTYIFDYIFDSETTQAKVYSVAAEQIVRQCFKGFDAAIIAYGQPSSGKTFTIQGDIEVEYYFGIASRTIDTLLETVNQASENTEFILEASVMGISGNKILDLLDPGNENCLLYTSDAADDMQCVDLGGRRIIKKKINKRN
eukprot:TRINITY_DN23278_c0_g1_i1.p1 TRINITY_DN23278_c0_g1~~TRINITY_DN23278_c0_g1_i1.p1  ORF type:complete len:210 (+),score=32.91 TRINITY_DN23278_c0_g1_i1:75-704(+)